MLKNYLKVTLRTLAKSKAYSFINISGLAIGLTCCLLITLYIRQELNFDRFHENADRIYRVAVENTYPDRITNYSQTPVPLAPALRLDYPEIEKVSRVYFGFENLIEANDKRILEDDVIYADPDFFDIFTFAIVHGGAQGLLDEPSSIVLTQSAAQKYFGDENPLGKPVRLNNKYDFKVTGVVQDVPVISHFTFDFVISYKVLNEDLYGVALDQWGAYSDNYTFFLLPENLEAQAFEQRLSDLMTRNTRKSPNRSRKLFLQPLTSIHLHAHNEDEISTNNFVSNLIILAAIGIFLLLIACINFMNLSTARSSRRAKEVGIRKVLGAARGQLTRQFLGESLIIVFLAMTLSLALLEAALPYFSQLVGREIDFVLRENTDVLGFLAGLALVVGLASGIYPALVLSAFRPMAIVKGTKTLETQSKWPLYFRRFLVVTQFAISIGLIFGTLTIKQQLQFMQNTDLGFKRDLTIAIMMFEDETYKKSEIIKRDLLSHPNVLQASAGFKTPIGEYSFDTSAYPQGRDGKDRFSVQLSFVDFDYFDQFGMALLAGRSHSNPFATDSAQTFVVNETLAKRLGAVRPEDVVGRKLLIGIRGMVGEIIGVVKDFHIASMHDEIQPLIFSHWPRFFHQIAVTIRPENIPETLAFLQKTWQKYEPVYPFKYEFLDDTIEQLYESEQQAFRVVTTFSGIAIFLACMGLFGLSAFAAEQRTKEIGVRKVLGATVRNIVGLLSQDFVKLVILGGIVAAPLAHFLMNMFLQEFFAYRIEIDWTTSLLAILAAVLVALLTVSSQAIRAALTNPVETLRYE